MTIQIIVIDQYSPVVLFLVMLSTRWLKFNIRPVQTVSIFASICVQSFVEPNVGGV